MGKTKKIIISLSISLIVLLVLNYIIISYTNSDYVEIPIFKEDMLKGNQVTEEDIRIIQVKKTNISKDLLPQIDINSVYGKALRVDVYKGELVTTNKFISMQEVLKSDENYSYISIPITDLSYPTCTKLRRGDKVTVYYTAKNKDVASVIKDKQRLYSNTEVESLVTCLLFENVEVISVHDSTGKQTSQNLITDILIRLEKEEAMLVANLKSQGTFDIVLN